MKGRKKSWILHFGPSPQVLLASLFSEKLRAPQLLMPHNVFLSLNVLDWLTYFILLPNKGKTK